MNIWIRAREKEVIEPSQIMWSKEMLLILSSWGEGRDPTELPAAEQKEIQLVSSLDQSRLKISV